MKSFKRVFTRGKKNAEKPIEDPQVEETPEKTTVEAEVEETMADTATAQTNNPAASCKIYIVFYSMYGHVHKLAEAMKKGVDSVDDCEAILYQVAETLPAEVLEKMHAAPKPDVPIIDAAELPDAHGILFGFPTRFGMMCSQMKALFDATGGLWKTGALAGKPAGLFTATGTQGGGQETTVLTAVTQLAHHGLIFVPPGYTMGAALFNVDEVRGGGPMGAGTFAAADGSRQPSETELAHAQHQGAYFAAKAKLLRA